jgi:hypothetical protein
MGHCVSTECICWNSTQERESERFLKRKEKKVRDATHHIRIGTKVPPSVSNGKGDAFDGQHLKRTGFGGPRQCRAQTGNVFAMQPSANAKHRTQSAFYTLQPRITSAHPLDGSVCYTCPVVLCCQHQRRT